MAVSMMKAAVVIKLIIVSFIAVTLNGCTFIVKDDNATKYYGADEKRDIEFLHKILDMQQEL